MTPVSNERVSDERLAQMLAWCDRVSPRAMRTIKSASGLSTLDNWYFQSLTPDTVRSILAELIRLRSHSPEPSSSEPVWDMFKIVQAAYYRGYQWGIENPNSPEYVAKAAYDYADKITSTLSPTVSQPGTGAATSPAGDLVRRLNHLVSLNEPENGGPYVGIAAQECVKAMREAAQALRHQSTGVTEITLPKLTPDLIYGAAVGHYGKRRVDASGGPKGIAMTVNEKDYSFDKAFRRMWAGVRAALSAQERG